MMRNRLSPGVEGLEGRKLMARNAISPLAAAEFAALQSGLAAPLVPLVYQFGRYDATFRFAGGRVARSQVAVGASADGQSVVGTRVDSPQGGEQRLWAIGIDPSGGHLSINKSYADGSVMHGVYAPIGRNAVEYGVIDHPNGSTDVERLVLTSPNVRTVVLTDQILVGATFRTTQVGVLRKIGG